MEGNKCSSKNFASTASPVSGDQPDRLQSSGDSELPERQRHCEQQDEAEQSCAVQRHRGSALCPGGLLQLCLEPAGDPSGQSFFGG